MKENLILKGNSTYSWVEYGNLHFIGYFFDQNSVLYRDESALNFFSEHLRNDSLSEICRSIDGRFSLIVAEEGCYKIVSDSVNFFPIFYRKNENDYWISDDWDELAARGFILNQEAVTELETAGFVLGNETLGSGIFKNSANQILLLGPEENTIRYRDFFTESFSEESRKKLLEEAEETLLHVGKRLVKFINGRTAVVPLSGGYDSRLIVSLLKRMNYRNVVCFTYGKNNPEVSISKEVAQRLGFPWYFVDYTEIDITAFQQDPDYEKYLDFAANGSSMPYLMEYFAVQYLKKNQLIPHHSVFLPGHSGDFLGGSYILKTVKNNIPRKKLASFIASKYFIFTKKNSAQRKHLKFRIRKSIEILGSPKEVASYNMVVEEWDIQEKLAKFIFHSSQVFLFLGYECYFPLWDRELAAFYRSLPYKMRENKEFYDFVAETRFFKPLDISFPKKELKVSVLARLTQKLKDRVRYFFPWKIVLNRMNRADWPYYQRLTDNMKKTVEQERGREFIRFKTYNAVICAWYIEYVKRKYG